MFIIHIHIYGMCALPTLSCCYSMHRIISTRITVPYHTWLAAKLIGFMNPLKISNLHCLWTRFTIVSVLQFFPSSFICFLFFVAFGINSNTYYYYNLNRSFCFTTKYDLIVPMWQAFSVAFCSCCLLPYHLEGEPFCMNCL